MLRFTLCGLIALAACAPLAAAPATGVGDLDDLLLDDELAKSLSPAPAKAEGKDWLTDDEMLRRLLDQDAGKGVPRPAGEDAGQSPLASVANAMRRAEGLIADESDDGVAVPVQREVVAQLDRLIEQMEKQCQGGSCNNPSGDDKKMQASKRSQPKPAGAKPGDSSKTAAAKPTGKQANQSGTTNLGGAPTADPAQQQELMKAAWGHLPERVREQMLQGAGAEFLPEYREDLQQYYRRLAERSAEEAP